jgi:hypothetical protein
MYSNRTSNTEQSYFRVYPVVDSEISYSGLVVLSYVHLLTGKHGTRGQKRYNFNKNKKNRKQNCSRFTIFSIEVILASVHPHARGKLHIQSYPAFRKSRRLPVFYLRHSTFTLVILLNNTTHNIGKNTADIDTTQAIFASVYFPGSFLY